MFQFIRREKIYILMLFFVLAVNAIHPGHAKKEAVREEKSLSSMTFEEIGVTEQKVRQFFESNTASAGFFRYLIIFAFLIFITSLILNAGFLLSKKFKSIDFKAIVHKAPIPWGIPDIIRVILIIVFIVYALAIVESFIFKIFHINIEQNLHMIINTFFIDLFAGFVLLYFVIVKHRETLASLGLKSASFLRDVLSGVTAYIFIVPLLLVILILSVWLVNLFGYTPPAQPVFEAFIEEKRGRVLFFITIFVSVFGPIVEEMFFRGFMYSAIRKRAGVLAAAFLSASIFSLLHTNIVGFLPIMTLGVLLAYLYETTGSLVASMTVHILHNSIIVAFVFFIKEVIS